MEDREGNGFFPDDFLIQDIKILIIPRFRARLPSINDQTSEQALLTRTATTTRRSDPEIPFAILHTRLDYPQLASSGSWALVGRPHCRMSSVSSGYGVYRHGSHSASTASAVARADVTYLRKRIESDAVPSASVDPRTATRVSTPRRQDLVLQMRRWRQHD